MVYRDILEKWKADGQMKGLALSGDAKARL